MKTTKTTKTPETNAERIKRYTNIGFCQRSFYTPKAWYRAMKCMDVLVKGGYAVAYDYGYGKGKFNTTALGETIDFRDLHIIVEKSGLIIKPIKD